jgi:hypothetical protein
LATDVSNLAETKTGRELVDLPAAIATRGTGFEWAITIGFYSVAMKTSGI